MTTPAFVPDVRRQATQAIRGYVYQVDRTLECWLNLASGTELSLECGEDIDEVTRKATGQEVRRLEQVKHEESRLTLRSPNAVAAIANFIVQRQQNPSIVLRFRYLTNSTASKEQLAGVKTTGIALWRQIHEGGLDEGATDKALDDLRRILRKCSRPSKYNKTSWKEFIAFWGSNDREAQLGLIRTFEWVDQAPAAIEMTARLKTRLVDLAHAEDEAQAAELYSRLFTRVMKLLATPGDKILNRALLEDALRRPVAEADRRLYEQLLLGLAEVRNDVAGLKEQALQHSQQHEALSQFILGRLAAWGSPASEITFNPAGAIPSFTVPELVEHLTQRQATTDDLLQTLRSCRWLALEGAISCGKTHLSGLLARQFVTRWLSLRELTPAQAVEYLDVACFALAGLSSTPDLERLFAVCEPNSLWVLDDLPRMDDFGALAQRLVAWTRAAEKHQVFLLSTSHFALPIEVEERLGSRVRRLPSPAFTDLETTELLKSYGAPDSVLELPSIRLINRTTKGHPALLSAFARYLSVRDWNWDNAAIKDLLTSSFAEDLNEQTLGRLLKTLEEEERELLYRCTTRHSELTRDEVQILAEVTPPVAHPAERLNSLTGLWMQRSRDRKYWVSPLIQPLGADNLRPETRRGCHSALARHRLKKGRLDQFDLQQVVFHFSEAEEWEPSGGFLIQALHKLWEKQFLGRPTNEAGLTWLWWDEKLPTQMSLELRLVLRSYQVALAAQWQESGTWMAQNLLALLQGATSTDTAGLVAPLVLAMEPIAVADFSLHCQILGQILSRVPYPLVLRSEVGLELPEGQTIESFLWFGARHIRTADDLWTWLEVAERMPLEARRRAENDAVAPDGCLEVASRLWRMELQKSPNESKWESLQEALVAAAKHAFALRMPLLGAAFTRIAITIAGEELQSFNTARTLAQMAGSEIGEVEDAHFLVEDALGRALGVANQSPEAVLWLAKASERHATRFPRQQMQSWVCYAKNLADSKNDLAGAVDACRQATGVATALSNAEQARAWGELAIAAWRIRDWPLCVEALERAALHLVKSDGESSEPRDDDWKQAFVLLGHVLGYMVSDAMRQRPPVTAEGEEYFIPFQTMLLGFHSAVARLYKPEKEIFLWVQLASLCSALGFEDKARFWAHLAWEIVKRQQDASTSLATSALFFQLIPHWIENNNFAEAWQAARRQATDLVWSQAAAERGIEMRDSLSLQPLAEFELDDLGRQRLDTWVSNTFLLPCAFRLAQIYLTDQAEATRCAQDAADQCLHYSPQASFPAFWREVAELLVETYSNSISHESLLAKKIESGSDHLDDVFLLLGYLGASLKPNIATSDALHLHLLLLPHLDTNFLASNRTAYRRIVIGFCFDFWQRRFDAQPEAFNNRFLEGSGTSIQECLSNALSLAPEEGVKQLFIVLSIGLNVGGSPQAQQWLNEWALRL